MVSTAPLSGVDEMVLTTGRDAARAIDRMAASVENMEDQRLQFIAQGMDKPRPLATLGAPADGLFRFRATIRKPCIDLRIPQEYGDTDKNVRAKKAWENWAKLDPKQGGLGKDWKNITQIDRDIHEKYGLRQLWFTELPLRFESFYETDDPMVAGYIRERMQEPAFSYIFEESKPMMATLPDGTEIEVMPVTREGQMAAAAQGA